MAGMTTPDPGFGEWIGEDGLPIPVSELEDDSSWVPVPEQDFFEELSAAAYAEEPDSQPDQNGGRPATPDEVIRAMWRR